MFDNDDDIYELDVIEYSNFIEIYNKLSLEYFYIMLDETYEDYKIKYEKQLKIIDSYPKDSTDFLESAESLLKLLSDFRCKQYEYRGYIQKIRDDGSYFKKGIFVKEKLNIQDNYILKLYIKFTYKDDYDVYDTYYVACNKNEIIKLKMLMI